jgi:hypothetical protein
MSKESHIARLKISKIIENENGTSTLHFDLDDEFINWFKEHEGLKRFSHKRFSKFINESLKRNNSLEKEETTGVLGRVMVQENKDL